MVPRTNSNTCQAASHRQGTRRGRPAGRPRGPRSWCGLRQRVGRVKEHVHLLSSRTPSQQPIATFPSLLLTASSELLRLHTPARQEPTSQHSKRHVYRLAHRRTFPPHPPRGASRHGTAEPCPPDSPQPAPPRYTPINRTHCAPAEACSCGPLPSLRAPMWVARRGRPTTLQLVRALHSASTCSVRPHRRRHFGTRQRRRGGELLLVLPGANRAQATTHCSMVHRRTANSSPPQAPSKLAPRALARRPGPEPAAREGLAVSRCRLVRRG